MSTSTLARRLVPSLLALVGVGAAAAPADAARRISAFPSPGTHFARPGTTIALRGVTPERLGRVTVAGTRSGAHSFKVRAHSDGKGVSLVPDEPFVRGEAVRISTDLVIRKSRNGDFLIGIAETGNPIPPRSPREAPDRRSQVQFFHSRKDLRPPKARVTRRRQGFKRGFIFMAPKIGPGQNGPLVLDNHGRVVWFRPLGPRLEADGFRVQNYRGRPLLSWWEGLTNYGTGNGTIKMLDASYRQVGEVRAGNGFDGLDPHEFQLTPRGTAWVAILSTVYRDLSSIGGAKRAQVLDSIVQEIDLATGLVQFEWHSLDHVSLRESYTKPPKQSPHLFDYFHINSIDESPEGKIIVSGRNTWTIYRLHRYTGEVLWRLGGKRSSFRQTRRSRFAWQHSARVQRSGVITLFDNGSTPRVHSVSRGIGVRIGRHRAWLTKDYRHSRHLLSGSQGNVQRLSGGNVLIGWGQNPVVSEYAPHGTELFSLHLAPGNMSYRAFRGRFHSTPRTSPDVVASTDGRTTKVYVSWNGAMGVRRWEVLAGPAPSSLASIATVPRDGFETLARLRAAYPYVAVRARDGRGRILGSSRVIPVR